MCVSCSVTPGSTDKEKRKKKKENVGWRRRAWIQPQRREEPSSFTRVLGVGVNGYPGHVIFSTFSLLLFFSAAFAQFYFLNGQEILFILLFYFFVLKKFRTNRICIKREKRMQQSIVLLLLVLAGLASASLNSTFTGEYSYCIIQIYLQSTSFIINTRRKKLNPTTPKKWIKFLFVQSRQVVVFLIFGPSQFLCAGNKNKK